MSYACLSCGFVHDGKKVERTKEDRDGHWGPLQPIKPFHGFVTYRVCPECGHKQLLKIEED